MTNKKQQTPHGFCETPEQKCTMNYCDENGCQNRKRTLAEPIEMTDNKEQTAVQLYTEEQVKMAIQMADKYNYLITLEECGILNQLTPIELPSDEEIEQESNNEYQEQKQSYENSVEMFPIDFANYLEVGFIEGAKWMRDKIRMQGR
jgi:hypothetical protein